MPEADGLQESALFSPGQWGNYYICFDWRSGFGRALNESFCKAGKRTGAVKITVKK
jgi:hypothetical protein